MIFMHDRRVVFVVLAFLAAGVGLLLFGFMTGGQNGQNIGVGCTIDPLTCPDGSSVVRTLPHCEFSACPQPGELVGQFLDDVQGARLAVMSPEGVGAGVTYAIPLDLSRVTLPAGLSGKMVRVSGTYTIGNHLVVGAIAPVSPEPTKEGLVVLEIGEHALVGGVRITFNKVVSDSRCAIDVQCIWAGAITANVTLKSDTDSETLDMTSGTPPHGFDSYQVSILDATPAPRSTVRIDPSKYKITFKVEPLVAPTIPSL